MAASLSTPLIAPGTFGPAATALALLAGTLLAIKTGGLAAPRRPGAAALGVAACLVFGLGALAWASLGAGRVGPPGGGAAAGAVLGLVAAMLPRESRPGRDVAVLLLGAAAIGAAALALPPGVELANALLGGLGAFALVNLAFAAGGGAAVEAGALGALALCGGLVAWGDRLAPDGTLGVPLMLGWALTLSAAALAGGQVWPRHAALGAAAIGLLAAWALVPGLFQLPVAWWGCAALGLSAGAGLAAGLAASGPWQDLGRLVAVAGAGLLMVVDVRLAGIVGVALGGLGLATVEASLPAAHRARGWLALLCVVFAARVWLQLFLDRVALTGYGVDLTHPYATAALLAGALFPALFGATTRGWWGRPLPAAAVLSLGAGAPVLVGYFLHVEALGAWLVGLVAAVFVGTMGRPQQESESGADVGLAASILMGHAAVALLAAPWLVSVMNATRGERLVALAGLTAGVAVVTVLAWPRAASAASTVDG